MDETATPIRKVFDDISINTDIAHCFHSVIKIVSEHDDGQVKHRRMIQGLYQNPDGHFFLAFWNKMNWNDKSFNYDFVDDANLIDPDQATQWMMNYCPDKLESFMASMKQADKSPSTVSVTIRMPTELRDHLALVAKIVNNQSLNKICINLINAGMSMSNTRGSVSRPQPYRITMPNGQFAVDEHEHALEFDDPDEQALAGYAETLFTLYNFDYPSMFPFVLKTLYRLIHINLNEQHLRCFVNWLCEFYRVTYDDSLEYQKRNPKKCNQ